MKMNEKEKRAEKKEEKKKAKKWDGDDALYQRQSQRVIKMIRNAQKSK